MFEKFGRLLELLDEEEKKKKKAKQLVMSLLRVAQRLTTNLPIF